MGQTRGHGRHRARSRRPRRLTLRRRCGVRPPGRAAAPGAARALLPDARLRPRRRRRAAGRALRAWRGIARFEGRSSVRSWLYTVATRTCLDLVAARGRRALPMDLGPASSEPVLDDAPATDVAWLTPYPDTALAVEERESVELAFVAALQHLPGNQRAALLLFEVLGYSAARDRVDDGHLDGVGELRAAARAPRSSPTGYRRCSQQRTLARLDDARLRAIVEGYASALERRDARALVALLTEDVTWSMPPLPGWYRGRDTSWPSPAPCRSATADRGWRCRRARTASPPSRSTSTGPRPTTRAGRGSPCVVVHGADPAGRGDRGADLVPGAGGLPRSRSADRTRPQNHPPCRCGIPPGRSETEGARRRRGGRMIERSGGEGSGEGAGPRVRLDLAGMTTLSEAGIDFERANAARIYDYFLGGAHNFASDRAQAAKIVAANPDMPRVCRVNRDFLGRVVRWCLAQGVDQFLDLGSGVPTVGNVHEIALAPRPEARVGLRRLRARRRPARPRDHRRARRGQRSPRATCASPRRSSATPGSPDLLDFDRPVAILAVAVLHFIDDDLPAIFGRYRDALGAGQHPRAQPRQLGPGRPRARRGRAGDRARVPRGCDPGGPARPDADPALSWTASSSSRPGSSTPPTGPCRAPVSNPSGRTRPSGGRRPGGEQAFRPTGVRGAHGGSGSGCPLRWMCVAHTAGPDRVLVPRERASRTPRCEVRSARRVRPAHAPRRSTGPAPAVCVPHTAALGDAPS